MKVALVNKFFYNRGGDCIYTINLMHLLQAMGHEVAIFSMQYPDNIPSSYESYYPVNVDFKAPGIGNKLKAAARIFGGAGVAESFSRLLDAFQPDVVHLNNIHSYLSPVIARIAHERKIKVVWTMHDYKLICPSYSCLRHGKVCELCFHDKSHVLREKCMKESLAASLLAYLEALRWNRAELTKCVDAFICPSRFMLQKMTEGGFPPEKLVHLCNFIPEEASKEVTVRDDREHSYCYVGRLAVEKGVETFLAAAAQLPQTLYVAGDGPLAECLMKKYNDRPQLHFLGRLPHEEVLRLLGKVAFSVIPSECYENNPLGVIESLCCGTPVVGARIGGIPELIEEGRNGLLFESGNPQAAKDSIVRGFECFSDTTDHLNISVEAQNKFSAETFYHKLMQIYDK